ncbi:MAG: polysaccharide biosynthesis protein [Ruminococcaceae bacterium]|nr:polysaccharide biosynthesis protein [Oscillospiraceae bacterium]
MQDNKNLNTDNPDKTNNRKIFSFMERWHMVAIVLAIYDLVAVNASYFLALWLRFDCRFSTIPEEYLMAWLRFAPIYAVISVTVLCLFRLYKSIWKYASFDEFERIVLASLILGVLHAILITVIFRRMPITYYIVGAAVQFMVVLIVRFAYRFVLLERKKKERMVQKALASRVMLIGAGMAGQLILRDLHNAKEIKEYVCCIIDDNSNKWGRFIDGVPVVGGRDDILLNVEKYKIEKIFFAIPSATPEQIRDILNICKETNCELRKLPSVYEFVATNGGIENNVTVKAMKDVDVEDLLGRDSVKVNMDEIYTFLADKTIMVTGGGGSIGSELCRQIAKHNPKKLIVFDIYENNAHAIGLELKDKHPNLDLEVLIGSVRDSRRINQVFSKFKPDVVYHAAAHKHVPLMEYSPCEAIKNNAVGTYKTAYAAMMNGCKKFVLISTDKAVNPTNIMGASKRLCEMIIQSFDRKIRDGKAHELLPMHVHTEDPDGSMLNMGRADKKVDTDFVAVRFGNVLGSNGSVIPRFKEQIANGGPVTVTHPDIIRYFMTIPEAASLVLQAGTYAAGGEIFVLDMGSPVKIDTLARNLIRLSGLKPDIDIKISYTGLRPGEKLYEEKLMSEEGLRTTPNHLIHIGSPIPFDADVFLSQLKMLMTAAYNGQENEIRDLVAEVVTTYHPAGANGCESKGEEYDRQMKSILETADVSSVK